MAKALWRERHEATILDDLSSGTRSVERFGNLIAADMGDAELLTALMVRERFDVVMHFASKIQVGESVSHPALYYSNNLSKGLSLLQAMINSGTTRLVFSSSAAVYGSPKKSPIPEEHDMQPVNPYGFTKMAFERVLSDYHRAYGIHSISLRYFNAAGADPEGELGECHSPETHLIPCLLRAAREPGSSAKVFGSDYPTPDGTCIRDYVHVVDICAAHLLAARRLMESPGCDAYNLGTGHGYSVLQVIEAVRRITGLGLPIDFVARRPGDPPVLVADGAKAQKQLRWAASLSALDTIVQHAWQWESRQANPR